VSGDEWIDAAPFRSRGSFSRQTALPPSFATATTNPFETPEAMHAGFNLEAQKAVSWNLLFRHRFHGILSLLRQIARPKERLPRKSQRLQKKSQTIRYRPRLGRRIESPPS
jgi:hypothetical protein